MFNCEKTWLQHRSRNNFGCFRSKGNVSSNITTVEESRITENVPNTIDVTYEGSGVPVQVSICQHEVPLDNVVLKTESDTTDNETLYESLQVYSQDQSENCLSEEEHQASSFPQYIAHEMLRHRHFYVSIFGMMERTTYTELT